MENRIFQNRLEKLRKLMEEFKFPLIAINAGKDLKYISGLDFHLSERPVILMLPVSETPCLVYPSFETPKVKKSPFDLQLFPYEEDPSIWGNVVFQSVGALKTSPIKLGVSPTSIRFLELDLIQNALGHKKILSAENIFRQLYIFKDAEAEQSIHKAVSIAENAIKQTLPKIRTGVSERQIANELFINLLREGSESNLPFDPIVASGPNSANPHAVPGNRSLEKGDIVLIDWGARYNGYISDMTRSFVIGQKSEEFQKIAEIVEQANTTARDAIKPGISANDIDSSARDFINEKGYGTFFTHRTGHGIGLEEHENPFISQTSKEILLPGMTFTIEPGIYIPGKGGIRIEDNVIVTEEGCKTFTSLARDLQVI
jgi:Xaa-Pro dipeptidase